MVTLCIYVLNMILKISLEYFTEQKYKEKNKKNKQLTGYSERQYTYCNGGGGSGDKLL